MPTFNQDIREIRQTVYGRDMREPIADAILKVKLDDRQIDLPERPTYAEAVLDESVIDWIEYRPRTVYVNYEAGSENTTSLALSLIESEDYLMNDFRTGDGVVSINDDDYRLHLGDSRWTSAEMDEGSYIVYDRIEHKETYVLTFTVA